MILLKLRVLLQILILKQVAFISMQYVYEDGFYGDNLKDGYDDLYKNKDFYIFNRDLHKKFEDNKSAQDEVYFKKSNFIIDPHFNGYVLNNENENHENSNLKNNVNLIDLTTPYLKEPQSKDNEYNIFSNYFNDINRNANKPNLFTEKQIPDNILNNNHYTRKYKDGSTYYLPTDNLKEVFENHVDDTNDPNHENNFNDETQNYERNKIIDVLKNKYKNYIPLDSDYLNKFPFNPTTVSKYLQNSYLYSDDKHKSSFVSNFFLTSVPYNNYQLLHEHISEPTKEHKTNLKTSDSNKLDAHDHSHPKDNDDLSTQSIDYSAVNDKEDLFQKFKFKFSKKYTSAEEEENSRKNVYLKIEELKKKAEMKKMKRGFLQKASYSLTLNLFADMSPRRFRHMLGYRRPDFLYQQNHPIHHNSARVKRSMGRHNQTTTQMPETTKRQRRKRSVKVSVFKKKDESEVNFPAKVDWRESGCLTTVKMQGDCGSCWAFSATAVLECQYYLNIDNSSTINLSTQNLLDCSQTEGNNGCLGGSMELAYNYVQGASGLNTAAAYPYIASQNAKCMHESVKNKIFHMNEWSMVEENDEVALMQALANFGPVAVAIDATSLEFQLYKDGVLCYLDCSRKNVNHGVVVVGYTNVQDTDVWIIRNSWGSSWGMGGYGYVCRGSNFCGISYSATFPILEHKNGNK